MLFHRHHPKAQSVEWAYVALLALFTCILFLRPAVGMAGIGGLFVIGSLQVLANKEVIWTNYKKNWKKSKNKTRDQLTKPNEAIYHWNVRVLWPLVFFLGLGLIALSLVAF